MDRMLVVVFDTESKAYEGKKALMQLEGEGSIVVYAYAVVGRNADGTTVVRQSDDPGPLGTLVGTSVGALIGLLGGPLGAAIGAAGGLAVGGTVDIDNARVGEDFIDDVKQQLQPNKFAVVAEASRRLDDSGGHSHGSDRWKGNPPGPVRSEANG